MTENFPKIRAQKFLTLFAVDIAAVIGLFEDKTVLKKDIDIRVSELIEKIEAEIIRSNRNQSSSFESAIYTPALDECRVFINKYSEASNAGEAQGVFYDALTSIEYYSEQIKI